MSESLLGFVLTRLDQVESPVFLHRELERFPPEQLKAQLSEGLLRETSRATEIPRPVHIPGGGDLIVCQTAKGLFGVADEDDYFDPIPLIDDDVRQYEVVVSKLIDCIRRENDLRGVPVENGRRLFLVGERFLMGRDQADVYLSVVNNDPSEFILICRKVCPTNPRPVVMLVPRPIRLSIENTQLLTSWDVFVVPLTTYLYGESWKLPWDQILRKPAELPGKAVDGVYCRVITREGTRSVAKAQYEKLVETRNGYDMFIDGMTREASCRHDKQKPRAEKLTPKELAILSDFIQAAKPMRPYNTKTGNGCASSSSAYRLFEEARKKVDVKLGRYGYRAFRLHKNASDRKLNAHEFAPPEDLNYCLILPA